MINSEIFIQIALLSCFIGTFLGGAVALLGKHKIIQRISQITVVSSLIGGLTGTGLFLLGDFSALTIFSSAYFFPGNLVIDSLSALFLFLINLIGSLAVVYGFRYIENEREHYNLAYLQFITALFIGGMQMVVLATTPVFFLFAWEIMSFASFLLVMADLSVQSIKPAISYLVITHLGAGALLAGFLLLSSGELLVDFSKMATLSVALPLTTLFSAFGLFLFGFGSKAGLFPFHGWLPEAHPQAPSHISALMSGVMLKMAVYGILRILIFVLPTLPDNLAYVVLGIGLVSAIFGVFYSAIETDIKRILAFSSIENLGLIFAMLGVFMLAQSHQLETLANFALMAALYHSVCHALFKSGLFLTAGIAVQTFHTRNIEKMGGIAKSMRLFSLATLLLVLTGAALPPSGGFIGEWLMLNGIIQIIATVAMPIKIALLLTIIVFGLVAGIAVFSMVRYFGIGFLAESRSPKIKIPSEAETEMLLPVIVLGLVAFSLGAFAQKLIALLASELTTVQSTRLVEETASFWSLSPAALLGIITVIFLSVWLARRIFSNVENERPYHTWDCGQPIDASMEYTGTAFSEPIFVFFAPLLQSNKKIKLEPLVESNPWLVRKSVTIEIKPLWEQYFYLPVVKLITLASLAIKKLQNGNIQFYITLILISLIITAILSL